MGPTPGHSLVSGSREGFNNPRCRSLLRSARRRMRSNSGRRSAPNTKRGPVAGASATHAISRLTVGQVCGGDGDEE
ncbi:hypothetical protein E2C01_078157 [Portunus trituberculatus]|uniref:Uncharacterized protein n=1 Tax=Portunus trituberculatus TaxID=210409 RepID=A0A5B7IP68_PORTR|nr:hypothetical protein [Portunus trituberculatus]